MIIRRWAHRRCCAGLITLTLCAAVLTGCGGSLNSSGEKREIPSRDELSEETQDASQTPDSNQATEVLGAVSQNKGTIASLNEIKQKAISAGYDTTDLAEIQKSMAEGVTDGFNIVINDSQNPVLEFESAEKAQAFAEYVNAEGTGAVIVNGEFFTYLGAGEDDSIDENILQMLEDFMDAAALARVSTDIPEAKNVPTNIAEYKDAYALSAQISTDMSTLLKRALEQYNTEHPEGDPQNAAAVMPLMFNSVALCFTAGFGEDEAGHAGIVSAAEMLGITEAKVTRNGANDYMLSAKTFSDKQSFEIHGVYDPATDGFRMLEKKEGKVTEFYEFIPLGDGHYAFQNDTERALAVYRDGKLESFVYTRTNSEAGYHNETDSIFPAGVQADESWVLGPGEDVCEEYYYFDGQVIKLNVETFFGRVITEIPASAKAQ